MRFPESRFMRESNRNAETDTNARLADLMLRPAASQVSASQQMKVGSCSTREWRADRRAVQSPRRGRRVRCTTSVADSAVSLWLVKDRFSASHRYAAALAGTCAACRCPWRRCVLVGMDIAQAARCSNASGRVVVDSDVGPRRENPAAAATRHYTTAGPRFFGGVWVLEL